MKIAILTSGVLPVPAVQGGAVENLIDFYLEYNDKHQLHDITVFSVYHQQVEQHPALTSAVNHYVYLNLNSITARIRSFVHKHWGTRYYYYDKIEYFFSWALQKIKRAHFDVIILENRPGFALGVAKHCSIPIVAHIHTNLLSEHTQKNREIILSTSKFLPISEFIKKEIEGICLPRQIKVLYNGLDVRRFDVQKVAPIQREKYGLSPNDFVSIFAGRLVPAKGIKELLMAFLMLADHPDIKLMVLGSTNYADTKEPTPFQQELMRMTAQLRNRVIFTGFIPYDQIPSHLAAADVAVVPSHINEAFGMSCIEACAMGLPVIATNDGGIPEALVGQKHVLLEKGENLPEQIANALITVKEHIDEFQGNTLNPTFSKETYAKHFFEEIETI